MLTIVIPDQELFNDVTQEFIDIKGRDLRLEHSLVSLAKWESIFHKAFLSMEEKTHSESINYIKCMTITQHVPDSAYKAITSENLAQVSRYIENPMTATTFNQEEQKKTINREVITAEIIYYWMIALQIPMECQKWHLNRLLTLINVCNIKNKPNQKLSRAQVLARNKALNAERLKKMNTSG